MKHVVDWSIFLALLALAAISVSVIFATDKTLGQNQLIFWLVGLIIFYLIRQIYYPLWRRFIPHFYIITLLLLITVFFFAQPIRGAVRWIDIGILKFQPSEFAKVAVILSLASLYANQLAPNFIKALLGLILVMPHFFLILAQPDIGSALSILVIWGSIIFAAGFSKKSLIIFLLIAAVISPLLYQFLAPYQKERLLTFVSQNRDPQGAGYNIIQSKITIGSGQIFGHGLGRGSQSSLNFLPEAQSDFIFAAISEQLGFLGAALVIGLFVLIILSIIAKADPNDHFSQLLIVGTAMLLVYQFFTNVGMNLGLVPVTGITFPLVSYGGSSLVSTLILLGLIFSLKRYSH